MSAYFDLADETERSHALAYLAKGVLHPRRNGEQNRLLHAILQEIARQIEWAGKKREPEVWKRLLTAAWLRARGESVEILPALDGYGVDVVFRRTSRLSKTEFAELVEYIYSWAAEQDIVFTEAA